MYYAKNIYLAKKQIIYKKISVIKLMFPAQHRENAYFHKEIINTLPESDKTCPTWLPSGTYKICVVVCCNGRTSYVLLSKM